MLPRPPRGCGVRGCCWVVPTQWSAAASENILVKTAVDEAAAVARQAPAEVPHTLTTRGGRSAQRQLGGHQFNGVKSVHTPGGWFCGARGIVCHRVASPGCSSCPAGGASAPPSCSSPVVSLAKAGAARSRPPLLTGRASYTSAGMSWSLSCASSTSCRRGPPGTNTAARAHMGRPRSSQAATR